MNCKTPNFNRTGKFKKDFKKIFKKLSKQYQLLYFYISA